METTKKVTRIIPGGPVMLGGKEVQAAECCVIDYGKQGVSRVYIVESKPKPEEMPFLQKQLDEALKKMWLSAQENRRKKEADAKMLYEIGGAGDACSTQTT